jgi:hypothetical protein
MSTDEFVELVNKWMKDLKPTKTAETWAENTKMLGVMRRCIHFVKATYTQSADEVNCTPKSSTPPSMTPEKQIIYEMLVRANAHTYVPNRPMHIKLLYDVIDLCTTDLKRSDLESERMKDADLDDLILAVAQVSANDIPEDTDPMDGEFASFERTNVNNDEDVVDESENSTVMIDGTKVKKRALNKDALKNIRSVGVEKLMKANIVLVREKKEERHLRDIRAMREMAGHVHDMSTGGVIHDFVTEREPNKRIWWREQLKFARKQSNKTKIV